MLNWLRFVLYRNTSSASASHYWNSDCPHPHPHPHQIPRDVTCVHGYGGTSVITEYGSRTYESMLLRFHTNAEVNFPVNINDDLTVGYFDCALSTPLVGKVYFNYPVVLNGVLIKQRGSTVEFRAFYFIFWY